MCKLFLWEDLPLQFFTTSGVQFLLPASRHTLLPTTVNRHDLSTVASIKQLALITGSEYTAKWALCCHALKTNVTHLEAAHESVITSSTSQLLRDKCNCFSETNTGTYLCFCSVQVVGNRTHCLPTPAQHCDSPDCRPACDRARVPPVCGCPQAWRASRHTVPCPGCGPVTHTDNTD